VSNPTLNRFYSIHYLFPFLLAALSLVHLAALHQYGSTNPLGINAQTDLIDFYPYFYTKDLVATLGLALFAAFLVGFFPEALGHPDNNIPANPYSTPAHIVPEWYFRATTNCNFLLMASILLGIKFVVESKNGPSGISAFCFLFEQYRKALSKAVTGNGKGLSWNESRISEGMNHKKSMQATPSMAKFINQRNSLAIPTWILILFFLMSQVDNELLPENYEALYAVCLSHFHPKNGLLGPKLGISKNYGNWRLPKDRKVYGNRGAILALETPSLSEGRQTSTRSEGADIKKCVQLSELRKHAAKNENLSHIYNKVIHVIGDPSTLLLAQELLKSKTKKQTQKTSDEAFDEASMARISKMSLNIKAGKYKFSPARQIWIPKKGKDVKKPLAVTSAPDKVVQKAMELVLLEIYTPVFDNVSDKFRPCHTPHSALKIIEQQFRAPVWFIETDITECFDSIDHNLLMRLLSKRIMCQKTLALIRSSLKAGYIKFGNVGENFMKGHPQSSVLTPLLLNILMHEFDTYMSSLIKEHEKGERRRTNPAYSKILNLALKAETLEEQVRIRRQGLRGIPCGDPMDPNFIRVRYVRFLENFLISILGPISLARILKEQISVFLHEKLGLDLIKQKVFITKASKGPAYFLNTEIQAPNTSNKKVVLTAKKTKSRITARIQMKAPMKKLIKKLIERKFCKWNENGTILIVTGLARMVNMEHAYIIGYYNRVIRGIVKYYSHVDNRSSLRSLIWILRLSCARTLARKYKARTAASIFKKYKSDLACPVTKIGLYKPKTLERIRFFNVEAVNLQALERSFSGKAFRYRISRKLVLFVGGCAPHYNSIEP